MRATLTVVEDARGVVTYPLRGHALDLMPAEQSIVGSSRDAVVLVESRSVSERLVVKFAGDGWVARAMGPGPTVDGREIAVGEDAPLASGSMLGWPGLQLRFDVVTERPLARLQRRGDLLLFDCGGAAAPGRWPCLSSVHGLEGPRLVRGLVVAGAATYDNDDEDAHREALDRERYLGDIGQLYPKRHGWFGIAGIDWRHFDAVDGVPLKLLSRRGRGLAPALAVRLAARVARWLVETNAPLALDTSSFALTWDGELAVLPPVHPRPTETGGRGVVVELFVALFPETGEWFHENDAGSLAARALWHRLVDPYLGAFGTRGPEEDDLVDAEQAADALEGAARELPVVPREEFAAIVRGLFPDEWRLEQELREELALIDARGVEELWARS